MAAGWREIDGPSGPLSVHLSERASTRADHANVVVLCHGFPVGQDSAARVADSLPTLADRLAGETTWRVLVGCLRGVGPSAGDFSLGGWCDDLRALVDHGATLGRSDAVWLVGFGTGGALALCVAAVDDRVRGVACFGSPSTFADWAHDVPGMIDYARRVGAIHTAGFPPDRRIWAEAFTALRPDVAAGSLTARRVLIVHGSDDEEVPVADGRRLAELVGPQAELRILPGAGHRLRADPRAVALLAGWLERQ